MDLPGQTTLRHRKRGVKEVVQELDAFVKIVDDAKEEPQASKGLLSIISFLLIFVLLIHQFYKFFLLNEVKYKFSVDVDFDEKPMMDLDMIIATPCNNLAVMPVGIADDENQLNKNPSRFEMTESEAKLWQTLQKVHKENFKPGTPLRRINQITYINNNVEIGLKQEADEKQANEFRELENKRQEAIDRGEDPSEHDGPVFMAFIGSGMGLFQIIAGSGGEEKDEGTACRVSGKFPVQKGSGGRITISVGRTLPFANMLQHIGSHNRGNISHRIERLHFGEHLWGLVTPLSGTEQIATKPGTEYKYLMKIVPTRIYDNVIFGGPLHTFQYAVSYVKKEAKDEHDHVHDSIILDYEFAAMVVEVHSASMSLLQFLLRICSVIGGVFATSKFLEVYASKISAAISHFFTTGIKGYYSSPSDNDGKQPIVYANGK